MKKISVLVSFILVFFLVSFSFGGTVDVNVFENIYVRDTGQPVTESLSFSAISGPAVMKIYNGGLDETDTNGVSSSIMYVNGVKVVSPSDLNQGVTYLERQLTLNEGANSIDVELRSKVGGLVEIHITQAVEAEGANMVGPEGGTVSVTNTASEIYGTALVIPAGAMTADELTTIDVDPAPPAVPSDSYTAGIFIDMQPDGLTFDPPASLTMSYNDADNDGLVDGTDVPETNVNIYTFDGTAWQPLTKISQDTALNTITCEVYHFSGFGPLIQLPTYYVDADGDGYGDKNDSGITPLTNPGAGYSTDNTDCADSSASINPGATETCNGLDDDCDDVIDNGCPVLTFYEDYDQDGYGDNRTSAAWFQTTNPNQGIGWAQNNTDCNDNNANINPGATELCDGIDQNCDDVIDNGCTWVKYYQDFDLDGYGDNHPAALYIERTYDPGAGWEADNTDCVDDNANINPGVSEICGNGIDDNCDGNVDEGCIVDADGDGFDNTVDCDDTNPNINPDAKEICGNLADENCDGNVNENCYIHVGVLGPPAYNFASIQAAIDAANDNAVIEVWPGTYNENIDFKGKNLGIAGQGQGGDPTAVVVDGGQNGSVVKIASNENYAGISNMTIRNGSGTEDPPGLGVTKGGGIYAKAVTPSIDNCIIELNHATLGGGIYTEESSMTMIMNTKIRNNAGEVGGGIYSRLSSLMINFSDIEFNNVGYNPTNAFKGGGIYLETSFANQIKWSKINNNMSTDGGGIYMLNSDIWVEGCEINNNAASFNGPGNGGGICADFGSPWIDIRKTEIDGNSASNNGGGIYLSNDTVSFIVSNMITNNTCGMDGGGIYLGDMYSGGMMADSKILNNTIANNTANEFGGGIVANGFGVLMNTILWGNSAADPMMKEIMPMSGYLDIWNCDIEQDLFELQMMLPGGLMNCISQDPMFVPQSPYIPSPHPFDPMFKNSDFHIDPISPCVDAGTPDVNMHSGPYPLNFDYDEEPMPFGEYDIGADEMFGP